MRVARPGNATPGPSPALAPALVTAGIEYMAVVREWRRGIISNLAFGGRPRPR